MSLASCSYQTTYVPDATSVTATLMCASGDLEQVYTGVPGSHTLISQDLSTLTGLARPVLAIGIMESDPAITASDIADCISDADTEYYVNDKKLVFNSSGVSIQGTAANGEDTDFAGCFRKMLADNTSARHRADAPYGGLEVIDNLVTASGGVTVNVRVVVAMVIGNKGTRHQGGTYIKMRQSTGESSVAQIYCDSGKSFILDKGDTARKNVVCKVRCFRAGSQVTPSGYKWYLFEAGAWVQKATTATFTVDTDMISSFGDVKVECYSDAACTQLIASDIQTIQDASDPLFIVPNPNPADGTFYQTGGPTQIVFSPKVMNADGTQMSGVQFRFTVLDSAGNIQNNASGNGMALNTALAATFTLPQTIINLINEAPVVYIEAEG